MTRSIRHSTGLLADLSVAGGDCLAHARSARQTER